MKKFLLLGLLITTTFFSFGQKIDDIINAKEVERIEKTLASDEMRGRRAFTPDIDRAADFIANEFKTIGLETWNKSGNYKQEFVMVNPKQTSASCTLDNENVEEKNLVVITSKSGLFINEKSGFVKRKIDAGKNMATEARKFTRSGKNYVVLVDTSYSKSFPQLSRFKRQLFKSEISDV